MLRLARQAQLAANEDLPNGERIVVLANNSDRQGKSYGGHQSFLMSRPAWDNMMHLRMIPSLFYLMAFQASSIVFTGQGKVGSENGQPWVPFQVSQRADFIETLLSVETTVNRPLVNTRNEPLSGPKSRRKGGQLPGDKYSRLHVIFYDTNLAPVATYLKVGVMQLILAMIEAGHVDEDLLLEKPLNALHAWSRDPDLNFQMPLLSGQRLSAVELQLKFLEQARAFEAAHGFEGIVEEAPQIIELWEDTLLKLEARDFSSLRGRIDWIMKRTLLEQALAEHPQWDWKSTELTYLDQIYASIDPADGLFLSLDAAGHFEAIATESEIAGFVSEPPENTRAWTRAMLLRAADPERVVHVDWDRIVMESTDGGQRQTQIELPNPLGAIRSTTQSTFSSSANFASLLQGLQEVGVKSSTTDYVSPGTTVYLPQGNHHPFFNQRY
jgi:proteasome accessory factor A